MHNLLPRLPKPSHYAGIEDGMIVKPIEELSLKVALAFPDTYEVGMSYLGHKILYNIINQNPHWQAERVFAPELEAGKLMKETGALLSTLETSTPLKEMNAVGFSITHELCFTDVLYMLDLANIPARHAQRPQNLRDCPLVMAGGGAMMGAEAITPFFDLVCLGDGEELVPELLGLLEQALKDGLARSEFLLAAASIPGAYVPSLFEMQPDGSLKNLSPGYRPVRRIATDLNKAVYPVCQVAPVGAIHNRLSLEIARGCSRGCRFCHAGMVYRPVRERGLENLKNLFNEALDKTGFEEISFLSLSTGDFSALSALWQNVWQRCSEEKIALSLPSLRVGSVNDDIMEKIALVRRTGCTLAPEAGSQRLRDVINKGITEEQLLIHAKKLLEHGWRQVKLYFMIGLPTETDEDLQAIFELCRKTRDAGGKGSPRLAITASISPFVPKPFTPFQWEAQISHAEMQRRINYCRDLFKNQKQLKLRWHNPDSSHLEGLLSRADRRMADALEKAYAKGAVFCSWAESFRLEPWLEALAECQINADELIGERPLDKILPWEHLECGISRDFLERERKRAFSAKITEDCRYGRCAQCGACDTKKSPSLLRGVNDGQVYGHKLVFKKRDQEESQGGPQDAGRITEAPKAAANINSPAKQAHYRLWHSRLGNYCYLSQLELQAVIYRALRRAKLPTAFSQGFHPLPLLSFGKALPVGVESEVEWFGLTLCEYLAPQKLMAALNSFLASHLAIWHVDAVEKKQKTEQSISEIFRVEAPDKLLEYAAEALREFCGLDICEITRTGGKGEKIRNIRPMLASWKLIAGPDGKTSLQVTTDWQTGYVSPLLLVKTIFGLRQELENINPVICKTGQIFADGRKYIHVMAP